MSTPKDILKKLADNKKKSPNDLIIERTRGTVAGSLIGGGVGLIYAWRSKKSYLVCGILGVMIGGFISHFAIGKEVNKSTEKDKNTDEYEDE
jgi:uncharacterized protein YcfJ